MAGKGALTRQKIIDQSLQLFSVKGYYNTSLNDILDATELTKGGLYGHFKSKEEIWHAVYDQAVDIWKGIVFRDIGGTADPIQRLKKVLENDLGHYLGGNVFEGGCLFLNMLVELSGQSGAMSGKVLDGILGFSRLIRQWLKEADARGMLKPDLDLDDVAGFIVTNLNGCAAIYASSRDPEIIRLNISQLHHYLDQLEK